MGTVAVHQAKEARPSGQTEIVISVEDSEADQQQAMADPSALIEGNSSTNGACSSDLQ